MTISRVDQAEFARVLGNELYKARKRRGWFRKDLVARLDREMSLQTLATYELGTRHIPMVRFMEICVALDELPADIIRNTYARLVEDPETTVGWTLDLTAAASMKSSRLLPLRNWAAHQLQTIQDGAPKIALLKMSAIEALAELCELEPAELVRRLPQAAPRLVASR